jgi:hypothetical protein
MNERVDSTPVDNYQGVFSGGFDVEAIDQELMKYDRDVTVVVTCRVKPPRYKETKDGDLTRVNVLGVKEVAVLHEEDEKQILQRLNLQELSQMTLYEGPADPGGPEVVEDETDVEDPDSVFQPGEVFRPGEREVVSRIGYDDPALERFLSEQTPR